METFDFDYHTPTTEYPESGTRVQLGRSYVYTSNSPAPDQRTITLSFEGMFNYWNIVANAPDVTRNPKLNFYRFEAFYNRHKRGTPFLYEHPQYGVLTVTFKDPLKTPKVIAGGNGMLESFSVTLLEHP